MCEFLPWSLLNYRLNSWCILILNAFYCLQCVCVCARAYEVFSLPSETGTYKQTLRKTLHHPAQLYTSLPPYVSLTNLKIQSLNLSPTCAKELNNPQTTPIPSNIWSCFQVSVAQKLEQVIY